MIWLVGSVEAVICVMGIRSCREGVCGVVSNVSVNEPNDIDCAIGGICVIPFARYHIRVFCPPSYWFINE